MTSPEAEEAQLRPSEWWAQLKAQQQRWSVPPLPPKQPKRDRRKLIATAAVVVGVLVVAGVVWAVAAGGSGGNSGEAAATVTAAATVPPHATVSGWQVVVNAVPDDAAPTGGDGAVVVDVPANWTVAPVAGVDGRTTVRAGLGDGVCAGLPQSRRAAVTQTSDATADQGKAVADIVQGFLRDTGYANFRPQISVGSPHATTDGSFQDYRVAVTLLPPPPPPAPPGAAAPSGCVPPSEIVHVVAKSNGGGTFAVLVAGDQQVAGAAAAADLDKIAATVRTG
jgi:hypothetical protein